MPRAYASTASNSRCRSQGTCPNSRWYAASRSARNSRTSSAGRSSPAPNAATLSGSSAAVPGRAERQPHVRAGQHLAGELGQRLADLRAEHQPADLADHARAAGRPAAAASSGTISPIAPTTRDATGSHERRPGRQRALDPLDPGPGLDAGDAGRQRGHRVEPQVGQPDRLGDLRALAPGVGARWPAASADTAICRARSQLTGPLCADSSCCSAANSGALPARSSGMPPPGEAGARPERKIAGSGRTGPGRAVGLLLVRSESPNPNGTSVTSGLLALPCSPR